jgi:transaldolase/glucose-6-phosphate isomerase
MTNPLQQLGELGQAIWLDYIDRGMLDSGRLKRLIAEDGLKGVTSNPAIFEKAIGEGSDYDERIRAIASGQRASAAEVFDRLALADVRDAADQLRPVYDRLAGADGFVSLEVAPRLAFDTEGTITEARRLWAAVGRPNVMIKVPGTKPGYAAIRALVGEGINVNVTLLFALEAYLAVADAHMAGLEARLAAGGDISRLAGVASFFVSRIDTRIDAKIDQRVAAGDPDAARLRALRGQVAIANAKVAYQRYLERLETSRWKALTAAGARPQRLLWASTGTKDAAYSDVHYVEALIGPDTVNTVPPTTLDAFRAHGRVEPTLTRDAPAAERVLADAERLGLDLTGVTQELVDDGVRLFADAADKLLGAVDAKLARQPTG